MAQSLFVGECTHWPALSFRSRVSYPTLPRLFEVGDFSELPVQLLSSRL